MRNKRCFRGRGWAVRVPRGCRHIWEGGHPHLSWWFISSLQHTALSGCFKPAGRAPKPLPCEIQRVHRAKTHRPLLLWMSTSCAQLPATAHLEGKHQEGTHWAHLGMESAAPLCWALLLLLFQAGPESKGNKSSFLAKGRAGWRQPQETRAGLFPAAPKRCILVFKFSPGLELCRHEPFWTASINMNFMVCPSLPPAPRCAPGADSCQRNTPDVLWRAAVAGQGSLDAVTALLAIQTAARQRKMLPSFSLLVKQMTKRIFQQGERELWPCPVSPASFLGSF